MFLMRANQLSLFLITAIFAAEAAFADMAPNAISVSGALANANGNPVMQGSVDFKLELMDRDSTCVLYSEQHFGVNLADSKGRFSLLLGRGSNVQNNVDPANPTAFSVAVFENPGIVAPFTDCATGLTLAPGDERVVRVSYDLGTGYIAMTPDVPMTSSAYAIVASTLDGKRANDFVQIKNDVNTSLSQENLEDIFSATNFPRLQAMVNGSGVASFGGSRLSNIAAPTAGTDAANKSYVDGNLGGKAIDVSGVGLGQGDGKTLIWDAAAAKWVAGRPPAIVDETKLPLAGGTMSGSIDMGGNAILAAGNVNISPSRYLQLGTFTTSDEAVLASGDKGKVWYNTDLNALRFWDGATARTQVFLDNTGKISSSVLPTSLSGSDGYNLTNVNATYISGRRVSVQAPSASQVLKWNGSAWTPATDEGITGLYGDIAASGTGIVAAVINEDAVTTSKIANDAITSAKVAGGYTSNLVLMTDAMGGSTLRYATCPTEGEVLKWTASLGWQCSTVTQLSPVTSVAGKTGNVSLNMNDVDGWGTAALLNHGTSANNAVKLDANARIPAVDGGLLTNVNAVRLQARAISANLPGNGHMLRYNSSIATWEPSGISSGEISGNITSIVAGTAATGGGSSGTVTIGVDVGTTANKVVRLDSSARIPAVDGGLLTNVTAERLQGRALSASSPTVGAVIGWNGSQWEPRPTPGDFMRDGTVSMTGSIKAADGSASAPSITFASDTSTGIFKGATNTIAITTNSTERMRIDGAGNVGIGTSSATEKLDVNGNVRAVSFITTSDRRVKMNIRPVEGLEAVLKLRGVRYELIQNGVTELGVIAQEVERVFPEVVVNESNGIKAVKYQNLISPLIESTKQLYGICQSNRSNIEATIRGLASVQADVQKLKEENAQLKGQLKDLNRRLELLEKLISKK